MEGPRDGKASRPGFIDPPPTYSTGSQSADLQQHQLLATGSQGLFQWVTKIFNLFVK